MQYVIASLKILFPSVCIISYTRKRLLIPLYLLGEKMSSARGRCNEDNGMTEYERQKWEQVARNQEKMDSLRLRKLSAALQSAQPNKRTKVSLVQ